MSLVPGAGDGQFQRLLVAFPGLGEFTAGPVQRPALIERLSLTAPVADVAVGGQGLLQVASGPG